LSVDGGTRNPLGSIENMKRGDA